jgi:hypothetical protein
MFEPIQKMLELPNAQLFAGALLLIFCAISCNAIMASYYRRTNRPRWNPSQGFSSFPPFHFNAREWLLILIVGAGFIGLALGLATQSIPEG